MIFDGKIYTYLHLINSLH